MEAPGARSANSLKALVSTPWISVVPSTYSPVYGPEMGLYTGLRNIWGPEEESTQFPSDATLFFNQLQWVARLTPYMVDFPPSPRKYENKMTVAEVCRKLSQMHPRVPQPPPTSKHNLPVPDSLLKRNAASVPQDHTSLQKQSIGLQIRFPRHLLTAVAAAIEANKFSDSIDYSLIEPAAPKQPPKRKREVMTPTGQDFSDTDTSVFSQADGDSDDELPTQSEMPRMDAKAIGQKLYKHYCEQTNPKGNMQPPTNKVPVKKQEKRPS